MVTGSISTRLVARGERVVSDRMWVARTEP